MDLVELAEELFYAVFVGGCVFHYGWVFGLLYFFSEGVGNNYKVFGFKFNKILKQLHPIFLTSLSFAWSVYKINQKKR